MDGEDNDDIDTVHVQVACCKHFSGTQMTPVRVYLREYFSRLIGRKKAEAKKTARRRVKPLYCGFVLQESQGVDGWTLTYT